MTSEFAVAVHALVYLNHRGSSASSETLSQNICTNPARVRKVMAKLKKAGLVATKEGVDGGYQFCCDPEEVTLRRVSEALGTSFVSASWKSGNMDMDCLIASGMADLLDQIYMELNVVCNKQLEARTIQELDEKIFRGKAAAPCGKGKRT